MTPEQQQQVRTRSYRVPPPSDECASGENLIAPGDVACLRFAEGPFDPGQCVRVHSYTNAGFRGIDANVTINGERWAVSAGNLDPIEPAIRTAVADGHLVAVEDDYGTICFAPAAGDGVTAEIFRLWVNPASRSRAGKAARFTVTNAGDDWAIVFASDVDAAGAVAALLTAYATWGTDAYPFAVMGQPE